MTSQLQRWPAAVCCFAVLSAISCGMRTTSGSTEVFAQIQYEIEITPDEQARAQTPKELQKVATEIIRGRITDSGVAHTIEEMGENRLRVMIRNSPASIVGELRQAVTIFGPPQFRLVHPESPLTAEQRPSTIPGYEATMTEFGDSLTQCIWLKRQAELTGTAIQKADCEKVSADNYQVVIQFTPTGSAKFRELTRRLAIDSTDHGQVWRLAVISRGKVISMPKIFEEISDGRAVISGKFTEREALELSNHLNDPIDFSTRIVSETIK